MRTLPLLALAALAAAPAPASAALRPPRAPLTAVLAGSRSLPLAGQFSLQGVPLGAFAATPDGDVATGDVNGDRIDDVIAGGGTDVTVTDGRRRRLLTTLHPGLGATRVAAGDVTGDGRADVVAAPAAGSGTVKVFDGVSGALVRSFYPYGPDASGGIAVAAGDVDGDGHDDVVTAPAAGAPFVKVFSGADGSLLQAFLSGEAGLNVAAGDLDGDGRAEVLAASPTVARVYADAVLVGAFSATAARLAAGRGEIVVGSGSTVRVLDWPSLVPRAAFSPFGAIGGVALQRLG